MAIEADILIIGGGIVGLGTAFSLLEAGYAPQQLILVESSSDLLSGASGGNSGILHTGFDAQPGTLEHRLVKDGYRRMLALRELLPVPCVPVDAYMVAWSPEQSIKLNDVVRKAHAGGSAEHVQRISVAELASREPCLETTTAHAALLVTGEHLVCPFTLGLCFAAYLKLRGVRIMTQTTVKSASHSASGGGWAVTAEQPTTSSQLHASGPLAKSVVLNLHAKLVLNCAGLYGDQVDQLLRPSTTRSFNIKPRQGQFVVYSRLTNAAGASASSVLRGMILPVPSERTKGVIVYKSAYDHVVVGPTAEESNERTRGTLNADTLQGLKAYAETILPELKHHTVAGVYAGVRPATQYADYQLWHDISPPCITVGGIRSTGVSACLGIGAYIVQHLQNHFAELVPRALSDSVAAYAHLNATYALRELHFTNSAAGLQPRMVTSTDAAGHTVHIRSVVDPHMPSTLTDPRFNIRDRYSATVAVGEDVYRVTHPLPLLAWAGEPNITQRSDSASRKNAPTVLARSKL